MIITLEALFNYMPMVSSLSLCRSRHTEIDIVMIYTTTNNRIINPTLRVAKVHTNIQRIPRKPRKFQSQRVLGLFNYFYLVNK